MRNPPSIAQKALHPTYMQGASAQEAAVGAGGVPGLSLTDGGGGSGERGLQGPALQGFGEDPVQQPDPWVLWPHQEGRKEPTEAGELDFLLGGRGVFGWVSTVKGHFLTRISKVPRVQKGGSRDKAADGPRPLSHWRALQHCEPGARDSTP